MNKEKPAEPEARRVGWLRKSTRAHQAMKRFPLGNLIELHPNNMPLEPPQFGLTGFIFAPLFQLVFSHCCEKFHLQLSQVLICIIPLLGCPHHARFVVVAAPSSNKKPATA